MINFSCKKDDQDNYNMTNYQTDMSLGECWVTIDDGATNYTMLNTTASPDYYNYSLSSLTDGGYLAEFYCNDTKGNLNDSESINFAVDLGVTPYLNIPVNDTSTSSAVDDFEFNLSFSSTNDWFNFTFFIWDSDGNEVEKIQVENGTVSPDCYTIGSGDTYVDLECAGMNIATDEDYEWNVLGCSISEICAYSSTGNYTFTIDSINPDLNITAPAVNNTFITNLDYEVNYTVSDLHLASCWYSNDSYELNTSITCGENITTIEWAQGEHEVTIWVNDSVGNSNMSIVNFTIDSINPNLNITAPAVNNTWITDVNYNVNYTVSDDYLSECWYSNDTYLVNHSLTCGENITSIVWSEGIHEVTIWVNDSAGNQNRSIVNFTIDSTVPIITIVNHNPIYFDYANNYTFNWTYTEANPSECWYEYESANTTVACNDLNASMNITNHNLDSVTMWINDTAGAKASDTATWTYNGFVYSNKFNATTYATEGQTFILNMSSDGTQSVSADLIYNGVNKGTGTKTGNNLNMLISRAIDVPDITSPASFHWNVTYGSSIINTTIQSQAITDINLTYCPTEGVNITFINFSFIDEETGLPVKAAIDASTWVYSMGTSSESTTYRYSNTTSALNWKFCFDPPDRTVITDLIFKYSNTTYPQRTYSVSDLSLTNVTTHQTLYMLSTADGIYSSLSIIDVGGHSVEGVAVTIERQVSGVWVVVGQSTSGSDGGVTFWVNPDYSHRITSIKTGYVTAQVNVQLTQAIYTLVMQLIGAVDYDSGGIDTVQYIYNPSVGPISNGTHSVNVTVTADGTLENCKYELLNSTNKSQVLATGTSLTNSSYCRINHVYTFISGNNVFGRLSIDTINTTGFVVIDSDSFYAPFGTVTMPTWRHASNFFSEFADMSEFGEDSNQQMFSKFMFFFIVASILIGVFFYFTDANIDNSIYGIIVIFAITLIASVGGFFTIELGGTYPGAAMFEKYAFVIGFAFIAISMMIKQYRGVID